MGSVRAAPKFNEQGLTFLTFQYDSSIVYDPSFYSAESGTNDNHSAQIGDAVTLTSAGTVGLGSAGQMLVGKLYSVEPDVCSVAISGILQLTPATANPPLLGHGVTVDGTGKVTSAATPAALERGTVINANTTADDGVTTVCIVALASI